MFTKVNLKASTVLASVSLVGLLSFGGATAIERQTQAKSESPSVRPSETPLPSENDETKFAESLRRRNASPKEKLEAIEKLGQLGKKGSINRDETINALTDQLEFRRDSADPDARASARTDLDPNMRTPLPTGTYPAVLSLFYIGERSLPAVIKVLEKEEGDSLKAQNALWVIILVFDGDMEKAVRFLTDATAAADSDEAKGRLSRAADKLTGGHRAVQN